MRKSADTEFPNWSIKGVTAADREMVVAAAKRMRMPTGDYVIAACKAQIANERSPNGQVLRPELPPAPLDLDRLERLARLAIETAAADRNDSAMRAARAVIRNQLQPPKARTSHAKKPEATKITSESLPALTDGSTLTDEKETEADEPSHFCDKKDIPENLENPEA
jgi:hypothetical protein